MVHKGVSEKCEARGVGGKNILESRLYELRSAEACTSTRLFRLLLRRSSRSSVVQLQNHHHDMLHATPALHSVHQLKAPPLDPLDAVNRSSEVSGRYPNQKLRHSTEAVELFR